MRVPLATISASLLLAAASAHATTPVELDVEWQAPHGCPAYADVASWLQAVIPPDARDRLAELHVRVNITGNGNAGFVADVLVTREAAPATEPRIVEGRACEEVARSAIVVVSVAMSDALKAEPLPKATPVTPPAPAPKEKGSAPPVIVQRTEIHTTDSGAHPMNTLDERWFTGVAVGVESGFARRAGVRLDASLLRAIDRDVLVGLRVHAIPAVTIERDSDLAISHWLSAGLAGCWLPELRASLRVGACFRGEAGLTWARGSRDGDPADASAVAALALTPSAHFGQRLRLVLETDLELRVLRPRFETEQGDVLTRLPVFAGGALLGLAMTLP